MCGLPLDLPHPAHAEFVICDCTIENGSHYVRDVSFGEDRSRIRSGHAPQVMAALRNLALTLMHRLGESHMTATRRAFAFHPQQAFELLLQAVTAQQ
jgi:hypothetical protein